MMADRPETSGGPRGKQHVSLPYLTGLLLVLLFAWFLVWFFFYRATAGERLMVASFRQALSFIPATYVEEVDQDKLYEGAMRGMVAQLGDKHSAYLTASQMERLNAETAGEFGGIGLVVTQKNDMPLIVEVHEDGPAHGADIQVGDFITDVDGEGVEGLALDQVVDLIRGKVGTDLELGLLRMATGEALTRKLTREKINLPTVKWEMLEEGIGRLQIASFDEDLPKDVEEALAALEAEGMKGLILDLRRNSGGLVDQAVRVCDMFLEGGRIIRQVSRHKRLQKTVNATPKVRVDAAVPIVILVDEGTASSAEILAGALQANGRATVVGANTVGKGAVSSVVSLRDGSGLAIVVSHYELEGDRIIEGEGVELDVVVGELSDFPKDRDPDKVQAWRDLYARSKEEQLQKAVQILREKLSGP
ncbi:MAG: S41 family peptidase [Candidatus Brocadiae bacterium]|nr:S41 family peptidase [Candidatus Brocadiia bacterium]